MASDVKVDLGGQRPLLEKFVQFNEKHCSKGLMKISRIRTLLRLYFGLWGQSGPCRSEVIFSNCANWPLNLCTKLSKATVSRFWVISLFPHVITFFHCFICTAGTENVRYRGAPLLKGHIWLKLVKRQKRSQLLTNHYTLSGGNGKKGANFNKNRYVLQRTRDSINLSNKIPWQTDIVTYGETEL